VDEKLYIKPKKSFDKMEKKKREKKLTQISLLSNNDIILYQYPPIFFLTTRVIVSTCGWKGYMVQKNSFYKMKKT